MSRVQAFSRLGSKRPKLKCPGVQSPSVQAMRLESSFFGMPVDLLWPYMQLRKLDLVSLLSFLGRTIFEKDLQFFKLAHDCKNTPEAKFQNQWSFRICYHSFPKTFITDTLLLVITTFVNTKVRHLADMTDSLSAPAVVGSLVSIGVSVTTFSFTSVST